MVDTPNYSYKRPTVGADKDTWGGQLNENWGKIDTDLKTAADAASAADTKADEAKTDAASANTNANGRVSKSGDTMTGGLTITAADAQPLKIRNTGANDAQIEFRSADDANVQARIRSTAINYQIRIYDAPDTLTGGLQISNSNKTVQLLQQFNTDEATEDAQLISRRHGDARYVQQTNQPVFAENHEADGSGYQRIGNTVRCWGTSTNIGLDATGALVTFPVTFARSPIVTATVAAMEHRFTAVGSITTTSCRIRTSASNFDIGNQPVSWQAIGEIASA